MPIILIVKKTLRKRDRMLTFFSNWAYLTIACVTLLACGNLSSDSSFSIAVEHPVLPLTESCLISDQVRLGGSFVDSAYNSILSRHSQWASTAGVFEVLRDSLMRWRKYRLIGYSDEESRHIRILPLVLPSKTLDTILCYLLEPMSNTGVSTIGEIVCVRRDNELVVFGRRIVSFDYDDSLKQSIFSNEEMTRGIDRECAILRYLCFNIVALNIDDDVGYISSRVLDNIVYSNHDARDSAWRRESIQISD